MIPSNYHTHTVFCDGRDTPEEIVLKAIELGCPQLGFTGHSYTAFDTSYCMSKHGTEEYKETVNALKHKYKNIIKIYLGIEQDYFSEEPTEAYDYVIGSVHYVKKDGVYIETDGSAQELTTAVEKHYGGDFFAFAKDYYTLVANIYNKTKCDIVGHFDLITKFNEGNILFDTSNPRYIKEADKAIEKLCRAPVVFEINTGGMARGYRTIPYPEPYIIKEIQKRGGKFIYNSDCHDARQLLYGYNDYLEALKICDK